MLIGVNVAIFNEGKVLLTKREDFHVWCLPGGTADEAESLAETAVREVREETGLEVRLTRLVGIVSRPNWAEGGYHIALFAAEQAGGAISEDPDEVIEMGWFDPAALPEPMMIGQAERIRDAAAGYGGSRVITETIAFPDGVPEPRGKQYAARDASGLPRDVYYQQVFSPQGSAPSRIDVEGTPAAD